MKRSFLIETYLTIFVWNCHRMMFFWFLEYFFWILDKYVRYQEDFRNILVYQIICKHFWLKKLWGKIYSNHTIKQSYIALFQHTENTKYRITISRFELRNQLVKSFANHLMSIHNHSSCNLIKFSASLANTYIDSSFNICS